MLNPQDFVPTVRAEIDIEAERINWMRKWREGQEARERQAHTYSDLRPAPPSVRAVCLSDAFECAVMAQPPGP